MTAPVPIALLGSGPFAIPSFDAIVDRPDEAGVRVALVISQPDRPSGRGRKCQLTPVSAWAMQRGIELLRAEDVNDGLARLRLDELRVRHAVVIAFGQKLSPALLEGIAAINLHGSLLPRWRGAAPIQRSMMACDARVGVSVIEVSARMDAGLVFAQASTEPAPAEVSGELHDRLAHLGVEPLLASLAGLVRGGMAALGGKAQDESLSTRARKLSRADAWVDFAAPAAAVAARINGLSPWPGVDASMEGLPVKLLRARVGVGAVDGAPGIAPGTILADGSVACAIGSVAVLEVQCPGGRPCSLDSYRNGRRLAPLSRIACPQKPVAPSGGD
ncbi:MAG: methionyl-tRNA formyltransferase [Phycisphaerales bacterium]|nr:methionyl-tRNA formyltransferase [Phycisphaerales bacterium]